MGKSLCSLKAKVCLMISAVIFSCISAASFLALTLSVLNQEEYYYDLFPDSALLKAAEVSSHISQTVICLAGLLSLGFFLLSLVLLCCSAGYRKGADQPRLNHFPDGRPFDFYFACCVLLIVCGVFFSGAFLELPASFGFLLSAFTWMVVTVVGVSIFTTFAARIKCGSWYRNTLIYLIIFRPLRAILIWILNFFKRISLKSSLVWLALVLFVSFCVISFILCWELFEGTDLAAVLLVLLGIVALIFIIAFCSQLNTLIKSTEKMTKGQLDYRVQSEQMIGPLRRHGNNINSISQGMMLAVEERLKSEQLKTELITNVSHDLKTPLTSIVNYVDLLQKEQIESPQTKEYLEILSRQSAKLKKLTEDLIDASKASTGNIKMDLTVTNMQEFILQMTGEYEDKLQQSSLESILDLAEDSLDIYADGRYLWRVFDNLFNNACKYSQPNTRIFITLRGTRNKVRVTMKNTSRDLLNVTPEQLMERFVRGDSSRNSEGSGLGLSIARSLTELQKGKMYLGVDGDLFKITLEFDRVYA